LKRIAVKGEPFTAIVDAVLVRPNRSAVTGSILIRGGRIERIYGARRPDLPPAAVIDARGRRVTPGLIDLHVHGGGGRHFGAGEADGWDAVLAAHARFGTTSILPTLAASSPEEIVEVVRDLKTTLARAPAGARILGLHLEGPFLSIGKRGAQPLRRLRPARLRDAENILSQADGMVRIMTLAPELDAGFRVIAALRRAAVIAAIGHTEADYETARRAIRAGLSYATHLFNGYPPFHHRHPGALAAALEAEEVDCEIIADGVHVAPVMIGLFTRLKPFHRIVAVTDAGAALGGRPSCFRMFGRTVRRRGGAARLPDGTLVGSVIPLGRALRNLARFSGSDFPRTLAAATLNPARILGLSGRIGDLARGMDADLAIWEENGTVWKTLVGGEIVHEK